MRKTRGRKKRVTVSVELLNLQDWSRWLDDCSERLARMTPANQAHAVGSVRGMLASVVHLMNAERTKRSKRGKRS